MRQVCSPMMICEAGGASVALPAGRVREVLDIPRIMPLPNAAAHLLGTVDVRGQSVPVMDLNCLLGLSPTPRTSRTRLIILNCLRDGRTVTLALRADAVDQVAELDPRQNCEVDTQDNLGLRDRALKGVGRRDDVAVILLDPDRLADPHRAATLVLGRSLGS